MNNKYQEALDNLCKECEKNINSISIQTKENETYDIHHCGHQMCPYRTISNDYCEEYDTLKELINNYEKLETKVFDLEQELECVYSNPIQTLEECVIDLDIKNQKLKRALDEACDYLGKYKNNQTFYLMNKEEWKDHLLKESENNAKD